MRHLFDPYEVCSTAFFQLSPSEAIGVEEHDTGERHFYRQYRSFQFLA